jgi:hypothetical protein
VDARWWLVQEKQISKLSIKKLNNKIPTTYNKPQTTNNKPQTTNNKPHPAPHL